MSSDSFGIAYHDIIFQPNDIMAIIYDLPLVYANKIRYRILSENGK